MTMANSDVLNERDSDMAVVADVFTWGPGPERSRPSNSGRSWSWP
jgi:hypothetical protein